ncbi:MAG: hypothetical protein OEZ06_20780 [Myxococcales bacterium]|nr:hypothetical protein [Myxococcales bacterium]
MDFLKNYSIQYWLESCPQGYLEDTEYGHPAGESEPEALLEDPVLRQQAIDTTVQLVVGERAALAASSGLINAAPDAASKCFLATQTLDEARHVEIFTRRLFDLGVKRDELESVLADRANKNLVKFAELLLEKVDKKDFVAAVVGQNIILEGLAFGVFEMIQAANETFNPKFAHTLSGTIADERRHVGFGENRIGALIREQPEKRPEVEQLQKEMSYYMLATFADRFRSRETSYEVDRMKEQEAAPAASAATPEDTAGTWQGVKIRNLEPREMEQLLADTILKDFKERLARVGVEYQTPNRP